MPFKKNIATNTFTLGMRQDRTVFAQDRRSYRSALNGNIIFSGAGDAQYCNEPGTTLLDNSVPDGYYIVGSKEIRDKTVIMSTNDTFSEIGLLELDVTGTVATYTTLFNDEFDPNGDKLNFASQDFIFPAESCFETIDKNRVYWLEPNNEPRCFNTRLGDQEVSPEFIDGSYTPLIATGKYPHFYSVHSMSLQADFKMGRLKLKNTTAGGSLKTGMYELCYRPVTRDGYAPPWTPLTRHFFVTLDPTIPDPLTNYHYRSMYASNVMTNKGYTFTIHGVDTRFYQLEVAYVYSTDKDVTQEASIFYREKIDPALTDVDVVFSSTTGIAVSFAEFNRYIVPIRRGKAIGQKDKRLWVGAPETYGPFELDLSGVTIAPFIREMTVDTREGATTLPLTNMSPTSNGTISIESYKNNVGAAVNESYAVIDDFPNYKGVQGEHLLASYWGGETYPLSVVVFDLKGNPFYAQHIIDYTFPNRYDDPSYHLMTTIDGKINIMGMKISGIDLTDILYDADGKLQVSGIAICRGKRIPQTLFQGVILPATIEDNPDATHPIEHTSNDFHGAGAGFADSLKYWGGASIGQQINSRPYTSMIYAPDILFGRNIYEGTSQDDVNEETDQLELVSLYDCPFQDSIYPRTIDLNPGLSGGIDGLEKFYTKNYELNVDNKNFEYGSKSRIKRLLTIETFKEQDTEWDHYDQDDPDLFFTDDSNFDPQDASGFPNMHSRGVTLSWLIKNKDFKNTTYMPSDTTGVNIDRPRYYTVNYKINNEKYFTSPTQKSLAERLYIGTGHFQPINQDVLDDIVDSDGRYILNDVEVWGGDCYPWIFEFVRNYPAFSGDCSEGDYAIAHVVPLESSMNFALRRGRSFGGDGIRSEHEACNPPPAAQYFPNGIMEGQPEEFNLNSVVMHEGNVQMFIAKPEVIDPEITQFDYRWLYSNLKIFGEITDQYRTFLTSNYGDMEPNYGRIVGRGYLFEQMYCLQERAFSMLRINQIRAISTADGEPIGTGVTEVWQKPDERSTIHGTVYPYGTINTDKAIYWADYYNKCFCRFAQDGVTNISDDCEIKELSYELLKFFDSEQPLSLSGYQHVAAGWDSVRNMIYWTATEQHGLVQVKKTLAYSANPHVHSFVAEMDFYPKIYLNCKGWLLDSRYIDDGGDATTLWSHYTGERGKYHGSYRHTKIAFIVNDVANVDKLFDNSWASFNPDAYALLEKLTLTTDTQSAIITPINGDLRSDYRNLIFRNETVARPAPDNCDYTINVGTPTFPLNNFTYVKNGNTVVIAQVVNQVALQAFFVAQGFVDTYPIFTITQTPDTWTSITWNGLVAPILFTQSGCVSPIQNHLSGKYLMTEYDFLNADNKIIQFTSCDQSFRLIPKVR